MKEIERAANDAGLSYRQMMENAGYQAFAEITRRCPHPKTAAVFAGKGNNGGDGFVVARLLAAAGAQVRVVLVEGLPVTEDAAFEFMCMEGIERWPIDELARSRRTSSSLRTLWWMRSTAPASTARCGRTACARRI